MTHENYQISQIMELYYGGKELLITCKRTTCEF